MIRKHMTCRVVLSLALLGCSASAAFAQDTLTRAKAHYASAGYEEALQLLDTLSARETTTEAAAYRVYCLVALGRREQAKAMVETIVRADPLFRPTEEEAAPHIRAFFDQVRKALLPDVAIQSFAKAKVTYDRKEMARALSEFERTIAVIDEAGATQPGMADLRILALGFRDLARAAIAPAPKPDKTPPDAPPPPITSSEPAIYGPMHANVVPPVTVSRRLPEWRPSFFELNRTFSGEVQLLISESGAVVSASLLKSVHPRYDDILLEAAADWTFKPATKDGVAVKYLYNMSVQVLK